MSRFDPREIIASWPPRWRDEFEERAAILQFDGEMSRPEAEARAFAQVLKMVRQSREAA